MRHLTCCVLLIASLALPARGESADPFANILPPERTTAQVQEFLQVSPPPFTQQDVDRWAAEVAPDVEQSAGRSFKHPPVARVVSRDALAEAMADQMIVYAHRVIPDITPGQELEIATQAQLAASSVAMLSFGQYIDGPDELLIPAENYPGMLRLIGHESTSIEQVVKAVLAHELTHALQDQTLASGIEMPLDGEHLLAYRATIEGHATNVQALVADSLGLADGQLALLTAMAPARITDADPDRAAQTEAQKRTYEIVYRSGYRFMHHMAEAGGSDRLWEILASPPTSVAEIEHPDRYGAPNAWNWPGDPVVFRAMHDRFNDADWKRMEQQLSPVMWASAFRDVQDADLVRSVTDSIVGGGITVAQQPDGQSFAFITAFRLDDPAHGDAMLRAFDEMTRAKHEKMSKVVSATPLVVSPDDALPCDRASRTTYTITPQPDTSMDMVTLNVWRGQNFVSMSVGGGVFDDAETAAVITSVLDALDSGANTTDSSDNTPAPASHSP